MAFQRSCFASFDMASTALVTSEYRSLIFSARSLHFFGEAYHIFASVFLILFLCDQALLRHFSNDLTYRGMIMPDLPGNFGNGKVPLCKHIENRKPFQAWQRMNKHVTSITETSSIEPVTTRNSIQLTIQHMKYQHQINRLLIIFTFFLHFPTAFSQSLEHKIDSIITTRFNDTSGPGGVFMVAKNGKTMYQKAFGKANLEWGTRLNPGAVFQLGSITKQFTAIAILMLEERGRLKVSDTITRYIPDYPAGDRITIHHLLTHTSGIRDFTKMKSLRDIAQKEMTPKMMVDFFKNEPADFAPGEKFDYNNSGYVLLGYIIELVSGESYEDFIQHHIFSKAGMHQSRYASDRQIIPNRAYGYHKKESGYVNKTIISFSVPFSSGSLMSTATDMLKWQNALNQHLLLSEAVTRKAFSQYKLNNGEKINYGYGWHLREINGTPSREHGGSIFGFKSMGVYIPSEDIYVLGLSNCDCLSPTQITNDIAAQALAAFQQQRRD